MDPISQAQTSVALLTPLVEGTRADQLDLPTPCEEWTVRDLIGHFVMGGRMFAAGLRGESGASGDDTPPEPLGDDFVAAYRSAIAEFDAAAAAVTDLQVLTPLPFATVPAEIALRIAAADLLVHAWDLATATGQPYAPTEEFVGDVDAFYRVTVEQLRGPGVFGPEVAAPPGATALQRLVAFTGRTV